MDEQNSKCGPNRNQVNCACGVTFRAFSVTSAEGVVCRCGAIYTWKPAPRTPERGDWPPRELNDRPLQELYAEARKRLLRLRADVEQTAHEIDAIESGLTPQQRKSCTWFAKLGALASDVVTVADRV